ncbi:MULTISPECIES: hypothetical protein [unclassified Sphingobacterium]|uniref:hypothetical protein n=1 Tax=unclassified Sphingobacterium TaxID=2609468 RepID=UPI0025E07356|nr:MULTISPECIES: hypothetical protein [unclassified Sphingobacterium]
MDIGFEIIISKKESDVQNLSFQQPFFKWGGVAYPQGPEEALYKSFKIMKSDVPTFVLNYLPNEFNTEIWECFTIKEGLKQEINDIEDAGYRDELNALLSLFIENRSKWIVIFQPGYDDIDSVVNVGWDTVAKRIISATNQMDGGFIAWNYLNKYSNSV